MADVTFENLIIAGGRFANDGGDIEVITVPANSTIARGTVMGRITDTGKFVTSENASTDGSEIAIGILEKDIVNETADASDINGVVWKKGTFNSLGVIFGTDQTLENTQEDLHKVSIEITQGVA